MRVRNFRRRCYPRSFRAMGSVRVLFRKKGDHVSGSVIPEEGHEKTVAAVLERFFLGWCGKHCFVDHGFAMFTGIPFSVKGRYVTCRLPAALRRAGFAIQRKSL